MRLIPTTVTAPAAPPPSLLGIAARVDDRIRRLLKDETDRWSEVDPSLLDPLDALGRLVLSGGKRLRPAFCHWAFVGAGGDEDDPAVVDAGAGLEMLPTFALIHDDVMDGSATRRAMETIHVQFEERHAFEGWRGEGRRFGEGVAVLVGDLAFVYADHLLASAPAEAKAVFTELRLEVNVGQYLDLVGTAQGEVSEATARRISRFKSGKYTIERPLHVGAALAGGGRLGELAGPLSAYGLPLGDAFQMRDDLLGAFGDETVTGKPVGEDLREGKPTVLYAFARAAAGQGPAAAVLDRYGAANLTDDEIADIQDVMVDVGAVAQVEAAIDELVAEARCALAAAPLTRPARDALSDLAAYVAGRDR